MTLTLTNLWPDARVFIGVPEHECQVNFADPRTHRVNELARLDVRQFEVDDRILFVRVRWFGDDGNGDLYGFETLARPDDVVHVEMTPNVVPCSSSGTTWSPDRWER